jgi:hypothetical protein
MTRFDSWTLTARILLGKILFFIKKGPDYDFKLCTYVVFKKHEMYTGIKLFRQIILEQGTCPHQVLAATLTLSQPGGTDHAHLILVSTPSFESHRRACRGLVSQPQAVYFDSFEKIHNLKYNLVLLLLKKRNLLSKIPAVCVH